MNRGTLQYSIEEYVSIASGQNKRENSTKLLLKICIIRNLHNTIVTQCFTNLERLDKELPVL